MNDTKTRSYENLNNPTLETHTIYWQSQHQLANGRTMTVGSILNENNERVCEVTVFEAKQLGEIDVVTGFFQDVEVTNIKTGFKTTKKNLS